jgi:hypothetical protein
MVETLIFSIAAALCYVASRYWFSADWIVSLLSILMVVFIIVSVASFIYFLLDTGAETVRQYEMAKTAGTVMLASQLQGLRPDAVELIASSAMVIEGIIGDQGVIYQVRTKGMSVPIEFVEDYLRVSLQTYPYGYPVREVKNHRILSDYKYSEQMAMAFVGQLVLSGWAERPRGNLSAKFNMSIEEMASRLKIEL